MYIQYIYIWYVICNYIYNYICIYNIQICNYTTILYIYIYRNKYDIIQWSGGFLKPNPNTAME